ncbi:hypothetical protein HBA55_05740 [Pseudomaricurvus alkylphenolicus]|uniref:hypothetical protein n=1 Tax=Pseudomaricurvus alkylphenolicus TaxID=1306991 RepID=UPI001421EACC|nr:hypothetical protein [Pseudomaricurvus alkylphenolicus]NIB39077.1 hypothetical protein [Pseudomaricurvus alkylphenolicus]
MSVQSAQAKWNKLALVSAAELELQLMLDPYYGVKAHEESGDNPEVEAEGSVDGCQKVIDEIMSDPGLAINAEKITDKFLLSPLKANRQKLLVYLWCGAIGLPPYRDSLPVTWRWQDLLAHGTDAFQVRLNDLKDVLRHYGWPLPIAIFPKEPDNSLQKLTLCQQEYQAVFDNIAIKLPELERERDELVNIEPVSMKERQQKHRELSRIEAEIAAITSNPGETLGTSRSSPAANSSPIKTAPKKERYALGEVVKDFMQSYFDRNKKVPDNTTILEHLESISMENNGDSEVIIEVAYDPEDRDKVIKWWNHGSDKVKKLKYSSFRSKTSIWRQEIREKNSN